MGINLNILCRLVQTEDTRAMRELEKLHDNYRSSDDKHKNFQMKARMLGSGVDRHGVRRQ